MEPVNASSSAPQGRAGTDLTETTAPASDTLELSAESFVATIVRMDQAALERLFRDALR